VIGNYSSWYTGNCPITRMYKFATNLGIDVFQVDLIDTKAILLEFE